MTYPFLKKAQAQPDLADFCEYIKNSLIVLEDIQERYTELQLNEKVESQNMQIYHKCDRIIGKHLPDMVDNFCNFSFKYRNNEKIKVDNNTSLTPKELLLKNLAKIVEEVQVIEKDFNRNNSFNVVVQNKVLDKYGFQPELCLETGKVVKNNIQLENKFDYENFVENNQFKKPTVEVNKKGEPIAPTENAEDLMAQKHLSMRQKRNSIFLLCNGVGFIGFFVWLALFGSGSALVDREGREFITNIEHLQDSLKDARSKVKNYNDVNNTYAINSNIINSGNLYTPWKTKIEISPAKLKEDNDSFAIDIPVHKTNYKEACDIASKLKDRFNIVQIENYIIKDENPMKESKFTSLCYNPTFMPIGDFYPHTIKLISK